MTSTLHLAAVQPITGRDPSAEASTERAVRFVHDAAAAGAELVVFPEGYPGPLRTDGTYDPAPALASAAAEAGAGVCWSRVESDDEGRWFLVAYLVDREGREIARYVRVHPATGDVHATLSGTGLHPGEDLVVADFHGVPVGILICSELWIPEVARLLALRGAEVLLAPAGGGFREVTENWRLMARARAVENHAYVAMTSHMFTGDSGAALIAGPEEVVAVSTDDELVTGVADLERVRWLRGRDDSMESPKPFRALPGLLRARRPERYRALADPQPDAFDYHNPTHEPAPR